MTWKYERVTGREERYILENQKGEKNEFCISVRKKVWAIVADPALYPVTACNGKKFKNIVKGA